MRIISPFHDYYDCCQDPTDRVNIYQRVQESGEVGYWGGAGYCSYRTVDPSMYMFIIGFCGKVYPVCRFTYKANGIEEYIYTEDRLLEICSLYEKEMDATSWYKTSRGTHHYDSIVSAFKRFNELTRGYDKLFREYHTPIFTLGHKNQAWRSRKQVYTSTITINAQLRDYKFAKVFPPHLAAQEIEMYLFGVLGSQQREKIPAVSNSDLIESKGFNLKTSFRKRKATP